MHFIAIGDLNENWQSTRYLAIGQGYQDPKLRRLFQVGDVGTLSFAGDKRPKRRVPPIDGWGYIVRSSMAEFDLANDLVLDVRRHPNDSRKVPLASFGQEIKADQEVYLSPDPSGVSEQILVNATRRMIQGTGPHFDKLRGYMSGQDFSPSGTCHFETARRNVPKNEQLEAASRGFDKKQMEAAKSFVTGKRMVQLVQGPPGTGKT